MAGGNLKWVPIWQLASTEGGAGITPAAIELAQRGRLRLPQRAWIGPYGLCPPRFRGWAPPPSLRC